MLYIFLTISQTHLLGKSEFLPLKTILPLLRLAAALLESCASAVSSVTMPTVNGEVQSGKIKDINEIYFYHDYPINY